MHELSIAIAILDAASEEAERRGGVEVSVIHVRIGALSGVFKDALLSAYELARECSELASSRLVVEDVPVVIHCDHCNADRTIESTMSFCCSHCGRPSANVIMGRELEITALEILE
jgi:hydrogenase nickel incorporation protein HypA/HybF